ncbi:MAG: hypothetical protein Q8P42_04085 [Gallionella sp.]|nr:hypothetical protein [Gallionella sp.]
MQGVRRFDPVARAQFGRNAKNLVANGKAVVKRKKTTEAPDEFDALLAHGQNQALHFYQ